MDRHRIVSCLVCGKSMRSDTLKRHRKIHKDLLALPDDEVQKELRARREMDVECETKRQKIVQMAQQEGFTVPEELTMQSSSTCIDLETDMLKDRDEYFQKIELGKKVFDIISKGDVPEASLSRERQEALNLYYRQRPRSDISTALLRPWKTTASREGSKTCL